MSDEPSDPDRTERPSSGDVGTDPIAETAYDELADTYADDIETSPYNADLAFPGTTAIVPEVDGQRVLDAGCGTGVYTEWLLEEGADVVGIDVSAEMLAHARERVGDRATFERADLGRPLGFADDAFDGIVSVLALSYVREWDPVFAEFARVLEPGGFLVATVTHPFDEVPLEGGPTTEATAPATTEAAVDAGGGASVDDAPDDYFAVERLVKDWAVEVPYYRRPLSAMVNPLLEAGFRLETVAEPEPTERFRERWPERYETESKQPVFLSVRARY
jgi:SAM-dependent methyltransferase